VRANRAQSAHFTPFTHSTPAYRLLTYTHPHPSQRLSFAFVFDFPASFLLSLCVKLQSLFLQLSLTSAFSLPTSNALCSPLKLLAI
ncbi:hypothetical protein ACTXT7_017399, partial [Hymenolepis weldensis]